MAVRTGTIYREKRYECGNILDLYIYPVHPSKRQTSGRRRSRRKPTREVQKKLNRRHATEKLTRKFYANFTSRDLSLTLTYAVNPENDREAVRDMQQFLRKLRYRYGKRGLVLKYIWVMEKSGRGRYHFHVVLSGGMDRDEIEALWGHGYANTKRLQTDWDGMAALAKYITKRQPGEEQEKTTFRSYNCSKNLIDPEPVENDSRIRSRKRAAELADESWNLWHELYPGYEIIDILPFHSDEYGSVYIFARLRRTEGEKVSGDGRPKDYSETRKRHPGAH